MPATYMDSVGRIMLPLRIVQVVFAIIVLGLISDVASWWAGAYSEWSPNSINYLIFVAVWSLLALAYLVLTSAHARFEHLGHKFAVLAVEALTTLFWFAGFIALAVFLTDRGCFGSVCGAAKAAIVFGAFEWLLFAITMTMAVIHVFRSRESSSNRPAPEMAAQPHASA